MNHSYIDDHQVAELYLLGKLSPEEEARFEEHSMSCPECLDRLETAEKLRLGLRAVAAREVAAEAVKLGLLARLVRSRLAPLALMALLLVAVLPAGLLWRRTGRLEGELAQTREQLREELNRPAPTPAPDPEAGALRSQLEAERQEKERLAAELEKAGAPRINVPVVPLSPERSAPGAAPTTRISLSSSPDLLILLLELDATDFPRYRATVTGSGTDWRLSDLRPDAQGTLTLALPAVRLQPGDFTVRVEGVPAHGRPA
ncbi:MAG TPA: zf-HC2 domain-containing protein, partial [Thermoanaerobaculia bacterium]|nr:zf-HC2 domain-containing protein [Thermoanaerobaculia bacterium]